MRKTVTITEGQALRETVYNIRHFHSLYGYEATKEAILAGAWHTHPEFGDVKSILYYKDFDKSKVTVEEWITDIFIENF